MEWVLMVALALFAFCGPASALSIVGWEVYTWLRTGHWPVLTLGTVVVPLASNTDFGLWLAKPLSWYGFNQAVNYLLNQPLWLWIVVSSGSVGFFVYWASWRKATTQGFDR
jgi:hypothetical protein